MRQVTLTTLLLAALLNPARLDGETIIVEDVTIDYSLVDEVRVMDGADPPTTVTIVEGGAIGGHLQAYDSSIVTVSGGDLPLFTLLHDSSTLNIHAGSVYGAIWAHASSRVNVSGGEVASGVFSLDSSAVNLSGGDFATGPAAYDASALSISGGEFRNFSVRAHNSSTVSISGGYYFEHPSGPSYSYCLALGTSTLDVSGGEFEEDASFFLEAADSSNINLSGGVVSRLQAGRPSGDHASMITIDGSGFNYPYGPISETSGILTGTLADGYAIRAPFEIFSDASIVLVPEPLAAVLLACGVLALGVRACRGRKKRPADRPCALLTMTRVRATPSPRPCGEDPS